MTVAIAAVRAREVLDSRGRPTVEVDVELVDGSFGRASVPAGASTGRHEAHELRDGDIGRYGGLGVRRAVARVQEDIAPVIAGRDPLDQTEIDTLLVELDGTDDRSRLGANAILGVSLAVARAAANVQRIPLWRHLSRDGGASLPLPMVNIVSGGLHAADGLSFQDFLVVPLGAKSIGEALEAVYAVRAVAGEILTERGLSTLKADEGGYGPPLEDADAVFELLGAAVLRAGLTPGEDIAFALDVAATHFFEDGCYRVSGTPGRLGYNELINELERLVERHPIVSIEDGVAEDDWQGWGELTRRLGHRVQLLGDDLFATRSARLTRGIEECAANAVLVKMNQIGTLTETLDVIAQARAADYATVVSARSGETEDPFLADLAVGASAGQIKIGSLAQSDRLAKYNQLLRIAEELGTDALAIPRFLLRCMPRTDSR